MSRLLMLILALSAGGSATSGPANDVAGAATRAGAIGRTLLTRVRDSRERLRQGIALAKGEQTGRSARSPEPVRFYTAFDLDDDLLHYEYTRRAHFGDRDSENRPREPWESDVTDYYIKCLDRSITFSRIHDRDGPGEITLWTRDTPPSPGVKMRIYDVRAIGLQSVVEFQRGSALEPSFDRFDKYPPSEVEGTGNGRFRLSRTTSFPTTEYRYELWVDRERGFCPTRFEEHVRPALANPERPNKLPWSLQWVNTATWSETNGVWVPKTWRVENWMGKAVRWSYSYEFEWLSVNEPLAKELFTVESLKAVKGTLVTNAIGQHPFIERVIGEPDSVLKGTVFGQHRTFRRITWTWTQAALLAIGLTLGASLIAIVLCRHRARRRAPA